MIDLSYVTQDVSLLSSVAVILGAIFVVIQLRQNNKLVGVTARQAELAAVQTKLTTDQIKQNNSIADMDIVMRLYEFANTAEVQSAWLTVLRSSVNSSDDFQRLPSDAQVSFYQIAALFESLAVLRKKGFIDRETIEDTFMVRLAWEKLRGFIEISSSELGLKEDEGYVYFAQMARELQ